MCLTALGPILSNPWGQDHLGLRPTCLPLEAWDPRDSTDILPAPHPGLISMDAGVPSSRLCLCFPPLGFPRPLDRCALCVSICQRDVYVHPCHHWKSNQESKGCTSLLRFSRSAFHIWAEKPQSCKSLLHHRLLAGCQYSSPGIFLITFGWKNKPGSSETDLLGLWKLLESP